MVRVATVYYMFASVISISGLFKTTSATSPGNNDLDLRNQVLDPEPMVFTLSTPCTPSPWSFDGEDSDWRLEACKLEWQPDFTL